MAYTLNNKEHFNLYYIFAEDKEQKTLSKELTENIWKNIFSKIKEKNF